MKNNLQFDFTVDKPNNRINIKREFAADRSTVWDCYTKSELLDQWWIPKPWKTRTKSMDFRVGGKWHFAAVGPNGEEHWAVHLYTKIEPKNMFSVDDAFADAEGNVNTEMPQSILTTHFNDTGKHTLIQAVMQFNDLAQLEQTIAMGIKEGFTKAMENLDALLEKK